MQQGLDHFFILTEPGAPQADLLAAAGFEEGEPNRHAGQGTANRRFFFANTMLELLYVCDEVEAMQGQAAKLRIPERVSNPKASPFGLVVRESSEARRPCFPGWNYFPEYLPEQHFLRIGHNSDLLTEPLCIALPSDFPPVLGKSPRHRSPLHLTGLHISLPVLRISETLECVARIDSIAFRPREPQRMEMIFDHGASGEQADFRPHLPLLLRW